MRRRTLCSSEKVKRRFRTQLCKDGNKCRRPVCFFSHSLTELRSPTHTWTPTPDDLKNTSAAAKAESKEKKPEREERAPDPERKENISTDVKTPPEVQRREPPIQGTLPPLMTTPKTDEDPAKMAPLDKSLSPQELGKTLSGNLTQKVQAARTSGRDPIQRMATDCIDGFVLTTGVAPRMSNAFARKHGLNPKDGPSVNFQKLAGRQFVNSTSVCIPPCLSVSCRADLWCRCLILNAAATRLIPELLPSQRLIAKEGAILCFTDRIHEQACVCA